MEKNQSISALPARGGASFSPEQPWAVRFARRFFGRRRPHACRSKTANFDGACFFNEEPTVHWRGDVFKWLATRKPQPWPRWIDRPKSETPPARVHGAEIRTTFINHATVLVQTAGLNFLTDPVWSDRVGPFSWAGPKRVLEPGLSLEQLPKIDVILLSHDHYDHFDVRSLRMIIERDRPRLFTGLGVDQSLALNELTPNHFPNLRVTTLNWWESAILPCGTRISFTPCRHFSGRGLRDQNTTLWGSFVVSPSAPGCGSFYFAGDTGYGSHFKEVFARFGPMQLALLPIGAYTPRWFMGTVHMNPDDAVMAHMDLGAVLSVGIHFGTFQLADEAMDAPEQDLRAALTSRGLSTASFMVPEPGQGIVQKVQGPAVGGSR